jgi:hypothetical protein
VDVSSPHFLSVCGNGLFMSICGMCSMIALKLVETLYRICTSDRMNKRLTDRPNVHKACVYNERRRILGQE